MRLWIGDTDYIMYRCVGEGINKNMDEDIDKDIDYIIYSYK